MCREKETMNLRESKDVYERVWREKKEGGK